jgi:hypothetical protein
MMRRTGLLMAKISWGPARRLFRNEPEDMMKYVLLLQLGHLLAFAMRRALAHVETQNRHDNMHLLPLDTSTVN